MADANGFRASYRKLEARMQAQADADQSVFLPNPEPQGPVDHVFICMEPSLGRWARSPEEAKARVAAGFRNFISDIDTLILHFCISEYLCEPGERYYITDLSKGAMLVKHAGAERTVRYDRWYALLIEELNLVTKQGAGIFALGHPVARHLARRGFPWPFTRLIHYSGLAAPARAAGIIGHEEEFGRFRGSVALERVLATARQALDGFVPAHLLEESLAQAARTQLSQSRQQLMFIYKRAFEKWKLHRDVNLSTLSGDL